MKSLKFTETVLRDGHQSHIATRMTTEEMIPILEELDGVGYHALEVWGGATFDVCLRYLDENPWERLRTIKQHVKHTKLQMLLRGQNLLGYKHYPDDIVDRFIKRSIENGIDIIRVFDALNDIRNLEKSIQAIKQYGGHCQAALSYTISPVHTLAYFTQLATSLEEMGADSICIKDMAGILKPAVAYELITELKKNTDLPIELHGHATSGICEMTYLKAVEAGVDIIDTAMSPFAGGTSQPATESVYEALKDNARCSRLDSGKLNICAKHLNQIKEQHVAEGNYNPKVMKIEPKILTYQVPGGMLSNLMSQLQAQKADDRYEEVLQEIPKVRQDLGYPPLVTPLSQMVGTQAVFNVLTGDRYKVIPKEIKDYVKGLYGQWPAPIQTNITKAIIGDEPITTRRPADLIERTFDDYLNEISHLTSEEEMVLAYALFPDIAETYLTKRSQSCNKTEDDITIIELVVGY